MKERNTSQRKSIRYVDDLEVQFDGIEAGDHKPYSESVNVFSGSVLTLNDISIFVFTQDSAHVQEEYGTLPNNPKTQKLEKSLLNKHATSLQANPPMVNSTRSGIGSLSAGVGNCRINRSVMVVILRF